VTKIKICGLCREADIETVNRVLPDYVGFVFAPSRRRVSVTAAARMKSKLDPRIQAVGVFVNEDIVAISKIYLDGVIDLAQLHGDETAAYIRRLKAECGCPVIKAAGVGAAPPPLPTGPDYILFDTLSKRRGGGGQTFDWNILEKYHEKPFFLSGGLTADNVSDAIRLLSPFCADVSSGVETDGAKDADKIEKFVNTVRGIL